MNEEYVNVRGWCYIISSNQKILEAKIIKETKDGFVTLKFHDGGGIRLRKSRVFESEIEAKEYLRSLREK